MIEKFSKKRMILGIFILISLTILVLIIESEWETLSPKPKQFLIENNSTCYLREEWKTIEACHPCTKFEIASKSQGVCVHTHNKEILRCHSGEIVIRSCDKVAWLEEKNFWLFEVFVFVISIFSTGIVYIRQKFLDRSFFQRPMSA
ncbi:unnamed protein product [Diamesa hyperborea]